MFASSLIGQTIPAVNWSTLVGPQPKKWIVCHAMQAPEKDGTALSVANFFHRQPPSKDGSSCNFCIDRTTIIQCVAAELIAWHAPGANQQGIGIEHAGYSDQTRGQWLDPFGEDMLTLSARLCAELCRHFTIPAEPVDVAGLLAGKPGITVHAWVSQAFRKSKHWDPGEGFPLDWYVERVRGFLDGSSAQA